MIEQAVERYAQLRISDVCKATGLSRRTVKWLLESGKLAGWYSKSSTGRRVWRTTYAAIENLCEKREVQPEAMRPVENGGYRAIPTQSVAAGKPIDYDALFATIEKERASERAPRYGKG